MDKELRNIPIDLPNKVYEQNVRFDHLELALAAYGAEVEALLPKFKERGMTYMTLTCLEDEDLRILGVEDPFLREQMVNDFQDKNKTVHTFDKMLNAIDKSKYNSDILLGIGNHLENMSKVFRAAKLKLDLSAPRDVIHAAEYKSSTNKTLDQLELNLDEMEMILDEMEPPKSDSGGMFPPVLLLVTTSLIGICLSAFITIKLAR